MKLIFVILALLLVCSVLELVMLGYLLRKLFAEGKELPEEDTEQANRREQRERIDEGFENIMMFSVNGKTGFESFENGGE